MSSDIKATKLYTCAVCLNPFREKVGILLDEGADAWCPKCTKEADEQEMARRHKEDVT